MRALFYKISGTSVDRIMLTICPPKIATRATLACGSEKLSAKSVIMKTSTANPSVIS